MGNERVISEFMQNHYTDEKLAALLAHAEDGKLVHASCCCVLGIPTADHALRGKTQWEQPHYFEAVDRFGTAVGCAYNALAKSDAERRAKLIPLIKSEMSRREALRNLTQELSDLGEALKVTV
jgi:hypothetical protein